MHEIYRRKEIMDDDTYFLLFLASVIIIAGSLVMLWLQLEFNFCVIVVRALFNITPVQTVAMNATLNTTHAVIS
jgi:hypothetical protein